MIFKRIMFGALLSVILITRLFAGTTGKITGLISDSETGDPLPGANVMLEGTQLGAATDIEGHYMILNVPPGMYSLSVRMMGYQEIKIENIRIKIDLTTTINGVLNQTVLESGEAVTIVAERALVQMDMTGSLSTVGSDEIENLPVQSINDILELEAGVVQHNGLHIRGGRSGEVAFWVDGVSTTDVYSGGMGLQVENSAVSELQVISGTFNAEYGQAMSGIINVVTKEGNADYHGNVEVRAGDYISRDKTFEVYEKTWEAIDPETGRSHAVGKAENPLSQWNPNYILDGGLSGPIPLSRDKVTFFLNGRVESNEGYLYGRDWFKPYGLSGDSVLVPMNPMERYSLQGKVTWRLTPNFKISYNGFYNNQYKERSAWYYGFHNYKYNPYGMPQSTTNSSTQIFAINHLLSPTTFYDFRVSRFNREYEQFVYENPTQIPQFLVRIPADPQMELPEMIIDPSTPEGAAQLDQAREDRRQFEYFVNPDSPAGYVHADSSRQPIVYSFNRAGQDLSHLYRSTSYWICKFDLTSQINKGHQIKAGAELRLHELTLDQYQLQKKLKEGSSEEVIPFQPEVPSLSSPYRDIYERNPREFSLYLQDKMEFNDVILNVGLRFDYFDANSIVLSDPQDPNIYDPLLYENRYKDWVQPPDSIARNVIYMEDYIAEKLADGSMREYTPEERRKFMHKKVDPKMQLSPRLGIAYPITDKGVIHFSYGHFFQMPEFRYLYEKPDFKFGQSGSQQIVGNADLKPQRSAMYEIGLQQQIARDVGIDVTLFYRDVRDWIGTSPLIRTYSSGISYSVYENKDYSNVRGVTIKLEKRFSNHWFANVDYSYQVAEGTYSNPQDEFNALLSQQEPRVAILPLDWDQNHTVNASFSYNYRDWIVSFIGHYWTGRPYTPQFARGDAVGTSVYNGLRENSARLPNVRGVDAFINRTFRFEKFDLNLFLNVYNVFDIRDETNVYSDSGTADYTTYIDPDVIDYSAKRIGTIEDFVNQPGWYTAPRQIQLGASIEF